jgi:hypothetical protein
VAGNWLFVLLAVSLLAGSTPLLAQDLDIWPVSVTSAVA